MYTNMSYTEQRTFAQLKEHYDIEKELADRLRNAAKEERRSLYNVVYDERCWRIPHHPLVAQASDPAARARAVAPQMRLLRSFVKPETTFLELGPGDCALAIEVAKWVQKVYAVDVSEELGKNSVRPKNFEFHLADGINIPLAENSIDIAYSNQVMEHLHPEDAHDQLRNIYAALIPKGIYICITPNRLSGPHDISKHFDEVATGFHLKEYTIAELAERFISAGFSKVRTFVSYQGYVLSPMLPVFPFAWIEWLIEKLPYHFRKKTAYLLTAVKIVAIK
jgi:SAM-dependent methyltransferase